MNPFVARAAPSRTSTTRRGALFCLTVLFGTIIAINLFAFVVVESIEAAILHVLTAIFAAYLLFECMLYVRRTDEFGLISPVLLASVFHFTFAYLVGPTAAVFDPWVIEQNAQYLNGAPYNEAMGALVVAMLAAFAMWRGNGAGQPAARALWRKAAAAPLLRPRLELNWLFILGIEFGHLFLIAFAIGLSVYGVAGSQESREQNLALLDLLNIGVSAGTLSFFLIAIRYYAQSAAGRAGLGFTLFFVILILLHVFTGALSAFKSQIVMPFLIAAIASFVATRRVSLKYIVFAVLALYAAYQTVEPYRAYLGKTDNRPTDIASFIAGYKEAIVNRDLYMDDGAAPLASQISARMDLLCMSAVAIRYTESLQFDGTIRAKLQESILLSPLLAFIPRAIWTGKEIYSTGTWFAQAVLGRPSTSQTSIAMGPIGFLSIAGGTLAVVVGFFAIGALQALMFDGLARSSAGGFIIYISAAAFLFKIPTDIGPALTGTLRMLPIAFAAQLVLLSAGAPSVRRSVRRAMPDSRATPPVNKEGTL